MLLDDCFKAQWSVFYKLKFPFKTYVLYYKKRKYIDLVCVCVCVCVCMCVCGMRKKITRHIL